jgi:hypothetical protein
MVVLILIFSRGVAMSTYPDWLTIDELAKKLSESKILRIILWQDASKIEDFRSSGEFPTQPKMPESELTVNTIDPRWGTGPAVFNVYPYSMALLSAFQQPDYWAHTVTKYGVQAFRPPKAIGMVCHRGNYPRGDRRIDAKYAEWKNVYEADKPQQIEGMRQDEINQAMHRLYIIAHMRTEHLQALDLKYDKRDLSLWEEFQGTEQYDLFKKANKEKAENLHKYYEKIRSKIKQREELNRERKDIFEKRPRQDDEDEDEMPSPQRRKMEEDLGCVT